MSKSRAARFGLDVRELYPLLFFSGALVLLDQATKYLLARSLPLGTGKVVIPGFFNLVHVHNTGGAFSIFAASGSAWRQRVFIALTVIVIAVIVYAFGRVQKSDRWIRASYMLIVGGAVGNLIDRVRLGEVIDFLDFYYRSWHWPAFNVADAALSTGAVMLLVSLFRNK